MTRAAAWLCGFVMCASHLAAQEQQTPPVFRSEVDVVAVDVTVVDDDGNAVSDLTVDDFTLKVDGKPRRLVSAQYFSREGSDDDPPASQPVGYSTNEGAGAGRLILLVIDQAHIRKGAGRAVMAAAGRFVDGLSPSDRVGLAVIPGSGPRVNFTSNHALIKQVLSGVVGGEDRFRGSFNIAVTEALALERNETFVWERASTRECGGEPECDDFLQQEARVLASEVRNQTFQSLGALRAIIEDVGRVNAPKSLVFMSEGLIIDSSENDVAWLAEAAADAQVSLYTIQLDRDLFSMEGSRQPTLGIADIRLQLQGLEALAGMSRGVMTRAIGTGDSAFQRLARELAGDYLLSFEPEPEDRDGRSRDIRVETSRPGVTVRARPEFKVDRATLTAASTDQEQLTEMLRAPFLLTALPLRLTSYTIADPVTSRLRVILVSEIDQGVTEPAELATQLVVLNDRGRVAASSSDDIVAEPLDQWRPSRLQHTTAVLVEPGEYVVKLGVLDKSGRRGSVDHRVSAHLTRFGDLRASDLMLAEAPDRTNGEFRPRVGLDEGADAIATYVEFYTDDRDLLERVTVTVGVARDEDGPAVVEEAATIRNHGDERRRTADAIVSVGLLPPGDYVARAVLSADGERLGHVTRPFLIPPRTLSDTGAGGSMLTARGGLIPLRPFDRASVLSTAVVGTFVGRMGELQANPTTTPTRIAMEHAQAGRFGEILTDAAGPDEQSLAAFLRGLAELADGQLERAAGEFRTSLAEVSDAFPAMFYLGACYAAGGRDREAVGAWQTSLITEGDASIIYRLLADALVRLDDGEQAVVILEEARELWPDDEEFTRQLAIAHALAGQDAEAVDLVGRYLDLRPADHDILFMGLRMIYEAHADGRVLLSTERDHEHFERLADAYRDAGGPRAQLVSEWREFFEQRRP